MQRFSLRFAALMLAVSLACSLVSRPARADDVADESEVQFNLGAERYQAGDFPQALAHFLASNRLANNRKVLFNIGRTYEQLRQYAEAHRYYSRSVVGETDEQTLARAKEAIERVAARVALLVVETDPPGAHLFLNRKDLGERGTAPQRIALPPASYRVIASLPGYEDASSERVEVTLGGERVVRLKLRRIVGTLRVQKPPGAAVRLDAENVPPSCIAPCDVSVAPGSHTVIVSLAGHRTQQVPISIAADTTSTIGPDLSPETGSLVVSSDERGAEVEIDGTIMGFTPVLITVPVGRHGVRVGARGFRSVLRDVDIRAAEQTTLDVELVASDTVEAASRVLESAEDAPASVSLIGSRELRAMRYPTIMEALRGTRGIYTTDDRGYPSLGIRGFGRPGAYGNRVLLLLDGMPLNDDYIWSSYVSYDSRADLEDIDHIEVVRGPGSVLYGTSAFSGVVNLVTRSRDVPTSREVGVSAAGDGVMRARARVTQRFGKNSGVWASVAGGQSSGRDFFFPEYVSDGPPEVAGYSRGVDGARFGTLNGRLWAGALSLAFYANHHDKHLPTGQYETLLGDGRTRQVDSRGFVELRFEPQLGEQVTSLTRLHVNGYRYRGYFAYAPADGGVETDTYQSAWVGAEQRLLWSPGRALTVSVGGEAQLHPSAHQTARTELGGSLLNDEESFSLGAAYGTVDLRPTEAVKLSAGGRLDIYSTFGSSFNPRLGLLAKPYEGANVKLLFGKAFKAPSVYELYYQGVGQVSSPQLRPENVHSLELELSQRFTKTLIATAAAFTNYVGDLISLESELGADGAEVLRFRNSSAPVGTMGVELELAREWREGWMVSGSYSWQRSVILGSRSLSALVNLQQAPGVGEVPNAPSHLASFKAGMPILARALTLMTRLTIEGSRYTQFRSDAAVPQPRTDAAVLWDFVFTGVESRFGLDYSVGIYNAFDARAAVPLSDEFRQRSLRISGRSLLASASITF
ncbi:MAG: TonB-dependent receptor [Myxococcales bacterium]|nr:MAG: TonB-dependent receptor [Myxococcales bacterium]